MTTDLTTFFASGDLNLLPKTLDIEDYHCARRLHLNRSISDAEFAAFGLIFSIAELSPHVPCRRLFQNDSTFGEQLPAAYKTKAALPPLLECLTRYRLRSVKLEAQVALMGWHLGWYPGKLTFEAVTAEELLRAQASGQRQIGIQFSNELMQQIHDSAWVETQTYKGGFIQHDLCHLAKFRGLPWQENRDSYFYAQVGLFAWLMDILDDLKASVDNEANFDNLKMVFADMNGDVRYLFMALVARLAIEFEGNMVEAARWFIARLPKTKVDQTDYLHLYCHERQVFLQEVFKLLLARGNSIEREYLS